MEEIRIEGGTLLQQSGRLADAPQNCQVIVKWLPLSGLARKLYPLAWNRLVCQRERMDN